MRLDEVKLVHLVRWMKDLRGAGQLAPRTVLSGYGAVRLLFKDADREELIVKSPCEVDRRELPAVVDKDPEWRPSARYTRAELEQLISDERIPWDRRVLYALEGVGALRHGEAAG